LLKNDMMAGRFKMETFCSIGITHDIKRRYSPRHHNRNRYVVKREAALGQTWRRGLAATRITARAGLLCFGLGQVDPAD
jgi:hypothetical protein